LKKFNEIQQYAFIYLLLNYSTCFGRPPRPSSGVHKTAAAGSGMYRSYCLGSKLPQTWLITKHITPHSTHKYWILAEEHGTKDPESNAHCTGAYIATYSAFVLAINWSLRKI